MLDTVLSGWTERHAEETTRRRPWSVGSLGLRSQAMVTVGRKMAAGATETSTWEAVGDRGRPRYPLERDTDGGWARRGPQPDRRMITTAYQTATTFRRTAPGNGWVSSLPAEASLLEITVRVSIMCIRTKAPSETSTSTARHRKLG
jgi:hypothetical protein